jgi:hypothetical protein
VVLSSQPTADVTVTVSSGDTTEGTVGPTTLTFTPSNWNTAQTVNVTRVDDTLDDGDITYAVSLSASSSDADYQGKTGTVNVTNADDDAAPVVSVAGTTVNESAGTATLTFTRTGATGGTTTVDWATVAGTAAAGADYTAGSGTVTFAPGETSKTVSVTIAGDQVAEASEVFTVVLSNVSDATSPGQSIGTGTATVTVTDDDTAGIAIAGSPLLTSEPNGSGSFTVVLNSQPTANVTVTITGLDTTEGSLSTSTLTFTPSNWNTAQTVTVTGVDDPMVDGSQAYTLTATTSSSDPFYGGGNARTATVSVTNADNDLQLVSMVRAVGSTTVADTTAVVEGQPLRFEIELSAASTTTSTFPLAVAGTATSADRGLLRLSDGVTYDPATGLITVPAGVIRFSVTFDTVDDPIVEDPLESCVLTVGGVIGAAGILDNDVRPRPPVILDVSDTPTDPTPLDLLTGDLTQLFKVQGAPGMHLVLYTSSGQRIDPAGYRVTEVAPGDYRVDAQGISLVAGDYVVRQLDRAGNESLDSNAFTIDSVPEVEDRTSARKLLPGLGMAGRLEVIDQNRVNLTSYQSSQPPSIWYDSDGQQAVFGLTGGTINGDTVTLRLANGSVLEVNRFNGSYLYKPSADAKIDEFPISVRDPGGRGGNLRLTFEVRDLLDRDGVPATTEASLATRITGSPDLNGDGVPDATQNAVTTMAWTRTDFFSNAVQGNLGAVPTTSVVTVVANAEATGSAASPIAQLINFDVLPVNRDGRGGLPLDTLRNVSTPWDAISFSVEPLQSLGLIDVDPVRPGLQQRITIDISRAGVAQGEFLAYVKWISAETIQNAVAAGVTLMTLDGQVLDKTTQAGWYDFTQRVPGGDGARYITEGGKIKAVELILTDNAFGDVDFTVGRLSDPGMPVAAFDKSPPQITGPSGGPAALNSSRAIPENTSDVFRFGANEAATWSITGGADAVLFSVNADGLLSFRSAPDFEAPRDVGANNVYELQLRAVDAYGNASEQNVTVTVTDVLEPVPMFRADLRSGDRLLSTNVGTASSVASANGSTAGIEFYVLPTAKDGFVALRAWRNVLTGDLFYGTEGSQLPYDCYEPIDAGNLGYVPKAGKGAFDVHLWINAQGTTQIVGAQAAAQMGLQAKGYRDLGALFGSAAGLDGVPVSTGDAPTVELVGVTEPTWGG